MSRNSSRTSARSSLRGRGPASRPRAASLRLLGRGQVRAARLVAAASFSSRGIAFSTVCRSARIISVWIVEMSDAGFTSPSTWVTSSSRNTRVTWQIASASRMWDRNLLPSPSPSEAPLTMPAMSTNSTVAGSTLAELNISASFGEPLVRDPDHADVGLDRRERVVRREHVVLGQRVEEGRLARVGESDDADGESHGRGVYGRRATHPRIRRGVSFPRLPACGARHRGSDQ